MSIALINEQLLRAIGVRENKTLGDAYITVAGLPDPTPDHCMAVANTAIRFVRYLERRNLSHQKILRCRIGLATGAVVGVQKYVYDIFDALNNEF